MKFLNHIIKTFLVLLIGIIFSKCHSNDPININLELSLESYIRSIPKEERWIFQNYRRIWKYLAKVFAEGDLPTHKDFDSLFHYNRNEEKFLLRTMLTKDSLWNPYAIRCLDTLIKLQYQENKYQSYGLQIDFHYSEKDSGQLQTSRLKGLIHYANTSKYVQKEYFSKYVHGIYPIPLILDFTLPRKAKSYFCVNYDEVQVLDSLYSEFAFQILHHIRWFSGPLMDSTAFKSFISHEEKNIFLREYYRIVKLQQMCNMPEEDWQHRSVRPVIDALICILAKQKFHDLNIWKSTGLSDELINHGLSTLANQWINISPWLHHYISSCLQNIFHHHFPDSKIVLKLPSGKETIRRNSLSEPILISPIKIIYAHKNQPIKEIWLSVPVNAKKNSFNLLKTKLLTNNKMNLDFNNQNFIKSIEY